MALLPHRRPQVVFSDEAGGLRAVAVAMASKPAVLMTVVAVLSVAAVMVGAVVVVDTAARQISSCPQSCGS
jgi:hypothetical protein